LCYADLFQGKRGAHLQRARATATPWRKPVQPKAGPFTIFEEAFNQGYPQELKHFIECVARRQRAGRHRRRLVRAVLELIYAAYRSAGTGQKVTLPFHAKVSKAD
jgi:predicted dehydrogenase